MMRTLMRGVRDAAMPRAMLLFGSVFGAGLLGFTAAVSATPTPAPATAPATPAQTPAKKPIVTKPAQKPAQKPAAPTAPPACSPGESTVTLNQTESEIKCDEGFLNCTGELQLAARNCTTEFQSFVRIEIYEGARRTQVLEFSPASIAGPGSVWRETLPWHTPAELSVEVFYKPPGSSYEQSVRGPLKITNKVMDKARAACTECQGVWGTFGVNKYQGCNCKTTDAGKVCHDGDECQGYCVWQRYDSDAREEGICSETKYLAGCYPIIFKGASQFPPSKPPPRKRTTCVD